MGVLALLMGACVGPPVQTMSDARQMIVAAEQAGADRADPAALESAQKNLTTAESLIKRRDYRGAQSAADSARRSAADALAAARLMVHPHEP
jgi:Domain of unknown function (DUF4398)